MVPFLVVKDMRRSLNDWDFQSCQNDGHYKEVLTDVVVVDDDDGDDDVDSDDT